MMPDVRARVPFDGGGYLVRTNAAGFRSNREFVKQRTPGTFRAILFGDSQTGADGVSNAARYSDVLEHLVSNLEVFNYAISGTGTDQQYLTYLESADVEHDLVIIAVYVANIYRVASRFVPFAGAHGEELFYAKPYYAVEHDGLKLRHVPVPKAPLTAENISPEDAGHVARGVPYPRLRKVVQKVGMRDVVQKVVKFQPFPEYNSPRNPKWLLMRKILEMWISRSSVPVLLVPLPMWPFITGTNDPRGYQARFRELADATGCHMHDPLPDLWRYSAEERLTFRFKVDPHFTAKGHQALAASLAPTIERIVAAGRR